MKKIFNKVFVLVFSFTLFVGLVTPVFGETNNHPNEDKIEESNSTPRWWPGDPNPRPGSEAWLQNHMYLPAPSATAKKCALKALTGTTLTQGVGAWIMKGTLTAASFGATFGASYIIEYILCVFGA